MMENLSLLLLGFWVCGACADPASTRVHDLSPANVRTVQTGGAKSVACAPSSHPEGLTTYVLESGGVTRDYAVYVPGKYVPGRAVPIVFDIHGSGSDPEQELLISGMADAAEQRGFVVVLPVAAVPFSSGGFTWNVPENSRFPDDVRYVADVLGDVSRRLCVDRARVYAAGFSGGARLASVVACELSDRIASLGAVGGLRAPGTCARPVPVIAFHGTGDPINPYYGGGPLYWGYGIDDALAGWVAQNRCAAKPGLEAIGTDVERRSYANCAGGAEVTLYRIEGAGHVWPGSSFSFPPNRFGMMSDATSATDAMLSFFERHPLPVARRRPILD
jgi:polyhydroxybutyrate depolymerase